MYIPKHFKIDNQEVIYDIEHFFIMRNAFYFYQD